MKATIYVTLLWEWNTWIWFYDILSNMRWQNRWYDCHFPFCKTFIATSSTENHEFLSLHWTIKCIRSNIILPSHCYYFKLQPQHRIEIPVQVLNSLRNEIIYHLGKYSLSLNIIIYNRYASWVMSFKKTKIILQISTLNHLHLP